MQAIGRLSARSGRSLADRAISVLEASALDDVTRRSPAADPHLNSWDIALTSIGHARADPQGAARALLRLCDGQWKNGLMPHVIFTDDSVDRHGLTADDWDSRRSTCSPDGARTSGIVHPPMHATAALRVGDALGTDGHAFLRAVYPRLAAWHDYLFSSRVRHDIALVETWHPWETGMDNSPMWDGMLTNVGRADAFSPAGEVVEHVASGCQDPVRDLIAEARRGAYSADHTRASGHFVVHDVMFNSLLVRAELDLSLIARRVGHNATRHTLRSRRAASAINRELFDAHDAWYVDRDVSTGRPLPLAAASQLAPLFAGVPDPARAALLVDMWRAMSAPRSSPVSGMMASADPQQEEFSLTDGWRGPAWFSTNWLIHEGLRAYGYEVDAARIRTSMLSCVDTVGFWEHYAIDGGTGGGLHNASSTAALTIDLLAAERLEPDVA